jgi:uncharacterized surface protein with fasciclin (FAS1) repeats
MRMTRLPGAVAAVAVLATLAACSDKEAATPAATSVAAQPANQTLAAAISGAPGLTTVSTALTEAGLGDVFDGPGSYTVLAPDDDAFAKLGDEGKTLTDAEHRAELVALLRGHILPGHLTPDAIRKAIEEKKGPVTMRTLGNDVVTFSAEGNTIVATGADGARAKIDGAALVASNGVVLPLDGVVKSPESATAS